MESQQACYKETDAGLFLHLALPLTDMPKPELKVLPLMR